jgi:hypothetical protein
VGAQSLRDRPRSGLPQGLDWNACRSAVSARSPAERAPTSAGLERLWERSLRAIARGAGSNKSWTGTPVGAQSPRDRPRSGLQQELDWNACGRFYVSDQAVAGILNPRYWD